MPKFEMAKQENPQEEQENKKEKFLDQLRGIKRAADELMDEALNMFRAQDAWAEAPKQEKEKNPEE